MNNFQGMEVILSVHLVEKGEPYQIRRSWRERLFTRPWTPRQATRTVVPQIPYRGALNIGNKLMMHPETFRQLKEQLNVRP